MKLRALIPALLCTSVLSVSPVLAAKKQVPPISLPIPLPERANVQLDIDGTDQDVLGMIKTLVRGMEKANSSKEARAQANANLGNGSPAALVKLLTDQQLSSLLKDIHRLHLITYTLEGAAGRTNGDDIIRFHETPLRAEGGRQLLRGKIKTANVLMLGFDNPRTFAAIVHLPTFVAVLRADGYPNLEAVGSLIRLTADAAANKEAAALNEATADVSPNDYPPMDAAPAPVTPAPRSSNNAALPRLPEQRLAPATVPSRKTPGTLESEDLPMMPAPPARTR